MKMKIPRYLDIASLNSPPIVGNYYWVRCIKHMNKRLPVIGPMHKDNGVNETMHIHIDFRFMSNDEMDHVLIAREGNVTITMPIIQYHTGKTRYIEDNFKYLKRKCYREENCIIPSNIPQDIIDTCKQRKMRNMRCPHHNVDLRCVPIKNGLVRCPVHWVLWNVNTGECAS